ncbi:MAG TPA: TRAP transporter substrate-binding protein DctP, partial [Rhabdaerophilum sp.]|nr:TRAP transporter substrate-binding protein DctP [Rhabdaerophilum sp.]
RILGTTYYGTRHITTTSKAVHTPADMVGFKLRVPENDVFKAMAEAWGAKPTPMNFGEVYSGLQTKLIDGAENNWPSYESTKHFEVAKFYSQTEHSLSPEVLVMSKKTFDKFSADEQKMIKAAAKESVIKMRELWDAREKASEAKVRAGGAQVNTVEKQPFIDAMKPVYEKFVKDQAMKDLVAKIQAVQ